jgi:radical SAM protein with 4Fe4S-binding SPASM domain
MFFKQKSNVLFRNYQSFGYITDNRNFGYIPTDKNKKAIGDKILSESGAVFFSVLGRKPQNFDNLAKDIQKHFADVDLGIIKSDAEEFYCKLENDGFLVSGATAQECDEKDTRFSYKLSGTEIHKEYFPSPILQLEKSTQDFLEEYFKGKPQLTNLHIEITSRCNERCVHCYIPHDYKVSHIEPELFYNVLEQCKKMRLLHLTLSGGEPMLHKHFCDFLRKCREYDFSVNVLSNLTLVNDEIIEEMRTNPLLGIQVSLYSMDHNIHDSITQVKGSFEKTKNSILKLIDHDIPLQISCPIMKQNKNCYDDVIKWAQKLRIHVGDDYGIIAKYNHTTQNLSCRLSIKEIKEVVSQKIANDSSYLEQMRIEFDRNKKTTSNDSVCSVCHSSICVSDRGDVYPCAGWQDYVVGNVKNTSLQDIWDNSERIHYLRNLRKKDFPKCIQCQDKEFCTMCMVRNANENPSGDPLIVNEFFCNIAKLKRQILLERN